MSHNTLGNGEWLLAGNSLFSNDRQTELRMQSDGKIAVYHGNACVFQNTAEQKTGVKGIIVQDDGNFVIYDNNAKPIWQTDTASPVGNSTVICAVQNDGNVVLYKGTPIWSSKTYKSKSK